VTEIAAGDPQIETTRVAWVAWNGTGTSVDEWEAGKKRLNIRTPYKRAGDYHAADV